MKWVLIITAFHFQDGGVHMISVPMPSKSLCMEAAKQVSNDRQYGFVVLHKIAECIKTSDSNDGERK